MQGEFGIVLACLIGIAVAPPVDNDTKSKVEYENKAHDAIDDYNFIYIKLNMYANGRDVQNESEVFQNSASLENGQNSQNLSKFSQKDIQKMHGIVQKQDVEDLHKIEKRQAPIDECKNEKKTEDTKKNKDDAKNNDDIEQRCWNCRDLFSNCGCPL